MAHGDKILAKIRAHPAYDFHGIERGNLRDGAPDYWVYLKSTWKRADGEGRTIHETSLVLCYEILRRAIPDVQSDLFENFPF